MEVGPVIDAARRIHGVDVTIVRILETEERWPPNGGAVTYLAELTGSAPAGLERVEVDDDHDPRRAVWACPGGVAALTAWADGALARAGRARIGPVYQERTWNLSCVLRIPTENGQAWLKAVPPFFAHEPRILALLEADDPALVPPVIAVGEAVALLGHVEGDDQYDAGLDRLVAMAERWVAVQASWMDRTETLLTAGLPDERVNQMVRATEAFAVRADVRDRLTDDERRALDGLVAGLADRMARVADCGLPKTLVHGDFHPGNWRAGDDGHLVLIDWGDSCIGHPLIDHANFLAAVERFGGARGAIPSVQDAWTRAWRRHVPGCDPERAVRLLGPAAALRSARVFREFLDHIEPSEHRYHAHDPEEQVRSAIAAASTPRSGAR